MAEGTEPIRKDIDHLRDSMSETLEQIEGRIRGTVDNTVGQVRQVFDVRHQVSERPWLSLGLALAAGYLVGTMSGGDRPEPRYGQPGQPMRYYAEPGERHEGARPAEAARTVAPGASSAAAGIAGGQHGDHAGQGSYQGGLFARLADPLGDELQAIAAAAMRSAFRTLRESLQGNIPHFDAEYRRARGVPESWGDTPADDSLPSDLLRREAGPVSEVGASAGMVGEVGRTSGGLAGEVSRSGMPGSTSHATGASIYDRPGSER
ncbi:MAG: hypothetical protein OHK0015_00990 [Chloroflexi bacterium OHK40]